MATKPEKMDLVIGATKGKLVRFSYLHVHDAKLNTESGNTEYSVMVLIPKGNVEDLKAIRGAIEEGKRTTWLDQGKKVPPQFWNPLRDGDTDTKQDGSDFGPEAKGHMLLNAKCGEDYPPNVVGTAKVDGKFQPLGKREVKSGDWGRVKVNVRPYIKGTGGVGVYLSSLQKVKDGEPLGSQSSAENDFRDFDDDDDESSLMD